jgi:two-component system chemotaxis sensor kinase CheA
MDDLEAIKITFFQECDELLVDLENGLLAMQRGEAGSDTVNSVFRAVHSIKGGAGVFGFNDLVQFSHLLETVLDGLRGGKIAASPTTIALLLRAHDELIDHVGAARVGRPNNERRATQVALSLQALADGLEPPSDQGDEPDFGFTPLPFNLDDIAAPQMPAVEPVEHEAAWVITFRPLGELYRKANEPAVLLRELARLGTMTVRMYTAALPRLEALDPEDGYLGWRIELDGAVDASKVSEVFEFVDGDCDLVIARADAARAETPPPPPQMAFEPAPRLAPEPAPEPAPTFRLPPLVHEPPAVPPEPPVAAALAAEPALAAVEPAAKSVAPTLAAPVPTQAVMRIDPERVDRLIDLVGELVISQVMLAQKVQEARLPPSSGLAAGLEDLEQLTREIQDGVMAIRAQQVKAVFQRMPRLMREVAGATGKQVRLVTEGEATEVDRTVIERLADPLTHMIRNAVDHGIEPPNERIAAGKPPEGVITLSARHRGGRIVIEVADDGRGIDRRRVLQIAVSKGLVAADANLNDEAIDDLIFLPGFSTAGAVSDISGRGVGMDVVRRSVQALGGRIGIVSRPGEGSTITLSLPLTLAVLDGMLVDVCDQTLVAPLSAIIESIQPRPEDIRRIGSEGVVLAVRESYMPLIDIGVALGFRERPIDPSKGIVLLVETETGARIALVADDIQGQRQVVIKSLESNYGHVAGISAATIMGDGRVALIIDIDAIVAMRQRNRPTPTPFNPSLLAAE